MKTAKSIYYLNSVLLPLFQACDDSFHQKSCYSHQTRERRNCSPHLNLFGSSTMLGLRFAPSSASSIRPGGICATSQEYTIFCAQNIFYFRHIFGGAHHQRPFGAALRQPFMASMSTG